MIQVASLILTMAGLRAGHPEPEARCLLLWMGGPLFPLKVGPPMVSLRIPFN
jgi:hypothetical protein